MTGEIMKPLIIPLSTARIHNLERIAYRLGYSQYLVNNSWYSCYGDHIFLGVATSSDKEEWSKKCVWDYNEPLPATQEEISASLILPRYGPFTINTKDFETLRGMGTDHFEDCLMEDKYGNDFYKYVKGFWGRFKVFIYTSQAIPIGYFYAGARLCPWSYLKDEDNKEIPEIEKSDLLAGIRCFKLVWRGYKD